MKIYLQEKEAVMDEYRTRPGGLTEEEAQAAMQKYGRNALEKPKGPSLLVRFFSQMADPMIIVLLAAAAVSAVIAVVENESMADVIIILAVVVINSILGVYQDSKAEKSIEALQKMSAAKSRVLRNGAVKVVDSEELVPGDIVLLEAGDAVPADCRLIECASLKAEESALTGESVPVEKFIDIIMLKDGQDDMPLGDRKNMVYMGSTIVYGRGTAVVTGTGMNTEMGKIAAALSEAKEGKTPLQKKLAQLSKILTVVVLAICVVIFAAQLIRNGKFDLPSVMNSFMIAVSLAVAAIPEGLVAVVTVVLSIGVTNMSKRNAIIRKLTAVETLGCAQIICSDKTGTLTQNRMTVTDSYGAEDKLAKYMTLCCDAEVDTNGNVVGEPTEAALVSWAFEQGMPRYDLKKEYKRVGEAPFDSERKRMTVVVDRGDRYRQITKGGPDTVLERCSKYYENGTEHALTDEKRQEIMAVNKSMADKALRVLACAFKDYMTMPESFDASYLEKDMCFMGLTGMIDPIRPEVKPAIKECESAGIRPIMITGDHVDTASAIGRELGILREGDRAIMGSELDRMSDEEFMEAFRDISVYARVQPEHKTRIVKAWQDTGHVTAMTGDGVNDAPSIKTADIGVGMGITGTDVT
ncbi:MAG: HAD-IC family P-type ATPase, partial [Lachnospiraceae bacterium]|nr:HAD-IC family P-type ATPase [Lachnospiraceae bacterium]